MEASGPVGGTFLPNRISTQNGGRKISITSANALIPIPDTPLEFSAGKAKPELRWGKKSDQNAGREVGAGQVQEGTDGDH